MHSVDRGNGHVVTDGRLPSETELGETDAVPLEAPRTETVARRLTVLTIAMAGLIGLIGLASAPAGEPGPVSDQASGMGFLFIRIVESLGILTGVAGLALIV